MDFAFSQEQEMLRRSARDFLAKECPPKVVRKLMEGSDAYDPALWSKIAGLGWTALGIPEEYGGVGSFLDLIVVLEEAGRALLPGPFFATMGLAVPAIIEAGTEAQKKKALSAIASGEARATLALTEPNAPPMWNRPNAHPGLYRERIRRRNRVPESRLFSPSTCRYPGNSRGRFFARFYREHRVALLRGSLFGQPRIR